MMLNFACTDINFILKWTGSKAYIVSAKDFRRAQGETKEWKLPGKLWKFLMRTFCRKFPLLVEGL